MRCLPRDEVHACHGAGRCDAAVIDDNAIRVCLESGRQCQVVRLGQASTPVRDVCHGSVRVDRRAKRCDAGVDARQQRVTAEIDDRETVVVQQRNDSQPLSLRVGCASRCQSASDEPTHPVGNRLRVPVFDRKQASSSGGVLRGLGGERCTDERFAARAIELNSLEAGILLDGNPFDDPIGCPIQTRDLRVLVGLSSCQDPHIRGGLTKGHAVDTSEEDGLDSRRRNVLPRGHHTGIGDRANRPVCRLEWQKDEGECGGQLLEHRNLLSAISGERPATPAAAGCVSLSFSWHGRPGHD